MKNTIKLISRFVLMGWWLMAILLILSDVLSYLQLMGLDHVQLINRQANVEFAMWLIYPPVIIGWYILFEKFINDSK